MTSGSPVLKDLVLVGGGHSHVIVLRRLGMRPIPGVRITVVARDLHAPYSGMLPGLIAGLYEFDDVHIDLGPLARFAGARLFHGEAVGLDLDQRSVLCRKRPPVPYDVLSIDTGIAPRLDVEGAVEHAVPVKPIGGVGRALGTTGAACAREPSQAAGGDRGGGGGRGGVDAVDAARALDPRAGGGRPFRGPRVPPVRGGPHGAADPQPGRAATVRARARRARRAPPSGNASHPGRARPTGNRRRRVFRGG